MCGGGPRHAGWGSDEPGSTDRSGAGGAIEMTIPSISSTISGCPEALVMPTGFVAFRWIPIAPPYRSPDACRAASFARFDGSAEGVDDVASDGLAIETNALVKHFGDTKAVQGVDLAVRRGTVYGLLGPNGAGKTTVVKMLATLLAPTSGSARVLGHDLVGEPDMVRRRVSLTGQMASVDDELTGIENLVLLGRLFGFDPRQARRRGTDLLEAFGLGEAADRLVKEYSGGMRRRLDIAASIVVTPDLLFLDEPTTGLDPRSRNQVWDIVRALVGGGTTVLLTTQYLEEADQLAERVAIIDHGRVIAEGTTGELKASVGAGGLRVRVRDGAQRAAAQQVLADELGLHVLLERDPFVLSATADSSADATDAVAALARAGIGVGEFSYGQPSLDEVFLALTGHPAEPDDEEDAA
jgi:ABC-2 type transport system ATP-binding protein